MLRVLGLPHRDARSTRFAACSRSVLAVDPREDPAAAVAACDSALASIGREEMLGPFADLLRLPRKAAWSTPELDPPQLRHVVLDTLVEWIAAWPSGHPR